MEISEALFDAVGILIDKKIQSIKFDETIEATVTDAKKASSGEYIVSTGAAKFTAYSYDTQYREKDVVLVTIPQGNYDNQKIIVSKKVVNQNDPMVYQTPFEKFINISNNLIKNTSTYKNGLGIWANYNDTDYSWPIDKEFNEVSLTPIWTGDYTKSPLQGYLMLGVQAQFASYLADYYTVQGNYGLALQITFKEPSLNQTWNKYVFLDSDSFFGDPYNFETYYTQEEVFNISEYVNYPIVGLKLYLYQRNNFKDNEGNDAPTLDDEDWDSVSQNIYVKDPFVCVGIPIDTFQGDTAEIYCDNDLTYTKNQVPAYYVLMQNNKAQMFLLRGGTVYWSNSEPTSAADLSLYLETSIDVNQEGYFYKKVTQLESGEQATFIVDDRTTHNTKHIQLRWIHKDESSGIIKALSYDDIFSADYEIRWYRYKLGAQSPDEFAGAHWERFYGVTDEPDENQDWGKTQENDEATNQLQIKFIPNVNNQTEQIKAIILKKESDNIYQRIAISNILTFTNDTQVSNPATILDMNALAIKYDDNERGHYFLYNEAGDIGKNEDSEIRKLIAVFDPSKNNIYDKTELILEECTSITWTFPTSSTMIIPMTGTTKDAVPSSDAVFSGVTEVGFTIKKHLNNGATNNTVQLDVLKDGVNYHAFVQPEFGTAGDNGSDYKVILTWRDGKNALNLSKNGNDFLEPFNNDSSKTALVGNIEIFDQAGDTVAWPSEATVEPSWYVAEFGNGTTEYRTPEEEEGDFYYPVFFRNSNENKPLNYELENNPDASYQPIGYYYFIDELPANNDNETYFTFDPSEGHFIVASNDDLANSKLLYRKRTEDDDKKNKLEFRQVTFTPNPLNQETGELNTADNSIEINNGKKIYHYSTKERYFIRINDQYVLDPWETYSEVETYFEPIEAKEKIYPNSLGGGGLKVEANNGNHTVTIIADSHVNMDSLFILQLTLKNFGDYDLVSYYPIALKNGETETYTIQYIEGPDRVRYGSSGEADFYKNPYQITAYELINGQFVPKRHGDNTNSLNGHWKLLFPPRDNNNENNFKPALQETGTKLGEDTFDKPVLNPISIFIPDALPYGIQFFEEKTIDVVIGQEEVQDEEGVSHMEDILGSELEYVPIWTQPILVYENKYPSATLNKWNGKDIVTDNDTGTIVASGFAAGRKERDNTFTGVVLGDWSRTSTETAITKNTGIYGFNHGAMSYAFKDDGTGFIGKDGRGRIYLDGEKSQIFSSNWANQNSPQGMLLDIDDGYIKMIKNMMQYTYTYISNNIARDEYFKGDNDTFNSDISLFYYNGSKYVQVQNGESYKEQYSYYRQEESQSSNKYITLGVNQEYYPLSIGMSKNVSQRKFRVGWDGTAYIQNGQFEGNITGSTISGSTISAGSIYGGSIYGGSINGSMITTNSIDIDTTLDNLSIKGQIGAFQGNDGQSPTACLGIASTDSQSGRSIVLTSCRNIKLESSSSSSNEGLYLQGNVIRIRDMNTNGWKTLSEYIDARITAALNTGGSIATKLANYATTSALNDLQTLVNTYHPSSSNQGGS